MLNIIFSKKNVNDGRQFELDVARGLAVLFMVLVHVLTSFSSEKVSLSAFGFVIDFLGAPPAAPVFMFILGTGLVYSRKSDGFSLFKRGILILALGYILNFLRGGLPILTGALSLGDKKLPDAFYAEMVSVDILQFAGMAFLFFALIKQFKISNAGLMIMGILFPILNLFLVGITIDQPIQAAVSSLIWGFGENTCFPFLSWIIYPVAGYLFACLLVKCRDKDIFYRGLLAASSVLLAAFSLVFMVILKIDVGFHDSDKYFHQTIPVNLIIISFTLCWISLIYFVSKPLKGFIKSTIGRWSRNVLPVYLLHWIIIGWLSTLIHDGGYLLTIVLMVTLMAVSDLLTTTYKKMKHRIRPSRTFSG
ncbi:MAG: acyltransferase [bacterium]|nr:acyltransferase [bacterium]